MTVKTADGHLSYGADVEPRMGFFTDTSVCIGCKACEVACKEWNLVPEDGFFWTGHSFDNTGQLSASTWRHVAFIEQGVRDGDGIDQWLMSSDVCNGCGYCIPACPFGVISRRERDKGVEHGQGAHDGGAHKCTLCYDRLQGGLEPACAKACPTESIQFGPLDELIERARERCEHLVESGVENARLYGDDPDDGVGGFGAFFLLLDDPEVYGLPPDPVDTTKHLGEIWGAAAAAAGLLGGALLTAIAFGSR